MLTGARGSRARRLAADLYALLSDRDPWLSAPGQPRPADLGLAGKQSLAQVRQLDLQTVLLSLLTWEQQQRLAEQAPESLQTPVGNRRRLDYAAGAEPVAGGIRRGTLR
jgi:hypothetical protein